MKFQVIKNIKNAAALMGLATIMLSAQNLPPAGGAPPAAGAPAAVADDVKVLAPIQSITDPDAKMKAIDDFVSKFPTSKYRGYAFTMAGEAAQQKRDSAKAKFYYENAIKADPESDYAMIMLGAEIASGVGEHDLDKKQKLDEAQNYATKGMDIVSKRTKQAGETDAQFEESKKDDLARGHVTLGLVKNADQKYADAAKEFMLAITTAAHGDASNLIRAGMAYNNAKQYDEANKVLDQFISTPGMPDQYKKIAEDEKKRGQQLKSQK